MKKLAVSVLVLLLAATWVHGAERGSASEKDVAKAMVEEAAVYLNAQGKDKALAELNKAKGVFDKGELYVFAYDLQGAIVAHPKNAKLVGKNLLDVPDSDGKFFRKEIVEVAKMKGTGWVDYKYLNPGTKKPEQKTTYVKKAGDIILCAGAYK